MRIGFFIPEFPGQTHSFFWREISTLTTHHGLGARIVSTRLPAQPVRHSWTKEAEADYLYPVSPLTLVRLLARLIALLPRLLAQPDTRALLSAKTNWAMLLMALRLEEIVHARDIDHLHVHSCANAALIAALLNRVSGQGYSLVLHGPISDYGPHQDYKWRGARFGFVITRKLRGELLAHLPDQPDLAQRLAVVPMGVDTGTFVPGEGPRLEGPWRWFCCARLNPVKGFDTLLAAASELRAAGRSFTITIAGEDEQGGRGYRGAIEEMIRDAGLGDTVTLLGAVTQERVLAELQAAAGFVLPSLHEPLGVVYMEAMACGLATVGTDGGGVTELIEDGVSGRLVAPRDSAALARAMAEIMDNPTLAQRLGAGGRARILEHFDASRSSAAIAERLAS